jgi:hypothetical protein
MKSISTFVDLLALKLTNSKSEGWSHLRKKEVRMILVICTATTVFFGPIPLVLALVTWVILSVVAHVWVSFRNLRKESNNNFRFFKLTAQQKELLNTIKVSSILWEYHHDDCMNNMPYSAIQEVSIASERKRVSSIKNNHPEISKWTDKAIVEAIVLYEKHIAKGRINSTKRHSEFVNYLKLSELYGKPIKVSPEMVDLDEIFRSKHQ